MLAVHLILGFGAFYKHDDMIIVIIIDILLLLIVRAREALVRIFPEQLKDATFIACLKDDSTTKKWMSQLIQCLEIETPFNIAAEIT